MRHLKAFLIAVPVAAGLLLAPSAQAEGRHRGGGPNGGHHGGHQGGHHGGYYGGGGHGYGGGGYRHHAYRAPQPQYYYQPQRYHGRRGDDGGLAALALGLGAAAVIGGIIASQPPQYAPPAVAYAQPNYYPNGGYVVPPGYQAPYGYAPQYGN